MPTVAAEITRLVWQALRLDASTIVAWPHIDRNMLEKRIQSLLDTDDYPSLSGETHATPRIGLSGKGSLE